MYGIVSLRIRSGSGSENDDLGVLGNEPDPCCGSCCSAGGSPKSPLPICRTKSHQKRVGKHFPNRALAIICQSRRNHKRLFANLPSYSNSAERFQNLTPEAKKMEKDNELLTNRRGLRAIRLSEVPRERTTRGCLPDYG